MVNKIKGGISYGLCKEYSSQTLPGNTIKKEF